MTHTLKCMLSLTANDELRNPNQIQLNIAISSPIGMLKLKIYLAITTQSISNVNITRNIAGIFSRALPRSLSGLHQNRARA